MRQSWEPTNRNLIRKATTPGQPARHGDAQWLRCRGKCGGCPVKGSVFKRIGRHLRCGVVVDGKIQATREGTPQGGPMSPLLANILLEDLDKAYKKPIVEIDGWICRRVRMCYCDRPKGRGRRNGGNAAKQRGKQCERRGPRIGKLLALGVEYHLAIGQGKCRR